MSTHPSVEDLRAAWPALTPEERLAAFASLPRQDAEDFFLSASTRSQAQIVAGGTEADRRFWLRLLAPDDVVDLLQEYEPDERAPYLGLLSDAAGREARALLAYAEDVAGGLMSPRFARVRPDMTVEEAVRYVRRQARESETIYYVFVTDPEQRLLGVLSFRELLTAPPDRKVSDLMTREVVSVPEDMDDESVARLIARLDLLAVPVVDAAGRIKGIVTVDDVVDVVQEQATEDIQKLGGMQALDKPYLQTGFASMLSKRVVWLAVLFVGELLTASAMEHYSGEIAKAVLLAAFVPLIISSGGNSGSQATTLVIRAMALGEVQPKDWWRIVRREVVMGFALGAILAALGMLRVVGGEAVFGGYGEHHVLIGLTVALSLVGVVMLGTLAGSMLPFLLRRCGLDPASASAPFVATLVDVSGLIIYFTVAGLLLRGTLLAG